MRVKTPKPDNENLGQWNVFVCEGRTKDDRKARLLMAPERLQDNIKKHVITVFKLRPNK